MVLRSFLISGANPGLFGRAPVFDKRCLLVIYKTVCTKVIASVVLPNDLSPVTPSFVQHLIQCVAVNYKACDTRILCFFAIYRFRHLWYNGYKHILLGG